jgi:hypothetical protein
MVVVWHPAKKTASNTTPIILFITVLPSYVYYRKVLIYQNTVVKGIHTGFPGFLSARTDNPPSLGGNSPVFGIFFRNFCKKNENSVDTGFKTA